MRELTGEAVDALMDLFTAYGMVKQTERVSIYVKNLVSDAVCSDCVVVAVGELVRSSRRLPEYAQLLAEVRDQMDSDAHTPHITAPQLAPRAETWWRHEATKVILPKVGSDRDLAAFVAATLWWAGIEANLDRVAQELEDPIWILSARGFLEGKDVAAVAAAAFARARWATDHPDQDVPQALLELEVAS